MSERARGDLYTGGMSEVDLFSGLSVKEGYANELAWIVNENGYAPREAAMNLIRKFYRDDPMNPKKPFAAEFRKRVADFLLLSKPEELKGLRFYSAVGKKNVSPLDFFHGIDAWIEYRQEKDSPRVVTLDGTMREN